MTRANINCLAGMACPLCGSLEPFELAITIVATIYDSGVEDFNVLEWDRATACQMQHVRAPGNRCRLRRR